MRKQLSFALLLAAILSLHLQSQRLVSVTGKASYYHDKFHGRRTASGAPYHKDSMTCAHRTYPFGTMLKVKNIGNGREVIVKVIDRGPYSHYIIDLSRAAALKLDMIRRGFANVEISVSTEGRVPFKPMPDTLRLLPITLPDTIPPFIPPPLGVLP